MFSPLPSPVLSGRLSWVGNALRDQLGDAFVGNAASAEEIVAGIDLDSNGEITIFELTVGLTKYVHKSHFHTSHVSYIDACAGK